ncbi:hypothetical protein B0H14DRAFT_2772020 [Mycena olivaceomarginata]|nr:hypothetical protein B0H14DRAFT_2772020 [Mycena olivaceomarginata]
MGSFGWSLFLVLRVFYGPSPSYFRLSASSSHSRRDIRPTPTRPRRPPAPRCHARAFGHPTPARLSTHHRHRRPQRTHARMAPTALLSPRPQQTDAPTPRQVRLRAVTYYYC